MNYEEIIKQIEILKATLSSHNHDGISSSILKNILDTISDLQTYVDTADVFKVVSSSDNLKVSLDTTRTNSGGATTKVKEARMNANGTIKVSHDIRSSAAGNSVTGEIRKNGTILQTDTRSYDDGWGTYTLASISVIPGDLIQGYVASASNYGEMRNFRIYYDVSTDEAATTITD